MSSPPRAPLILYMQMCMCIFSSDANLTCEMVPRAEETRVLFRLFRTSFHYAKPKGEPTREDRYNYGTVVAVPEQQVWSFGFGFA